MSRTPVRPVQKDRGHIASWLWGTWRIGWSWGCCRRSASPSVVGRMSIVGNCVFKRRTTSGGVWVWVRDTTAGSGSWARRSWGGPQAMTGLDGMAERTWDAFVVCAIDDRRKGSMQSVGTWSLKTEDQAVHGVL
jgi:hypothetical protein